MADSQHTGAWRLARPVFFVGFMGAGKTSVARCLADACGLDSVDVDEYLERNEGRIISDIFAQDGEAGFRDLETRYLKELAQLQPRLIACGGGAVGRPENRAIMEESGFVVYLEVTADEAAARIPDTGSRPLFKDLDTARGIIAQRTPLYEAAADVRISTVGRSIGDIAEGIKRVLTDRGILLNERSEAPQADEGRA